MCVLRPKLQQALGVGGVCQTVDEDSREAEGTRLGDCLAVGARRMRGVRTPCTGQWGDPALWTL